tara:strand:+ start:844 stop:1080 length:237 start_codon:yes stop_codon:yes gene_type:complete
VIRRHDLVKFIGPSVCKFFTCEGSHDAIIADGVVGLALADEFDAWMSGVKCEILIGNEVFEASSEDLVVIQKGAVNVV